MDKNEQITVYSTNDANEAEIIRGAIHAAGMKCEILGEGQAGLTGLDAMEIQIVVRAEDFDQAKAFIEKHAREA